MNTNEIRREVIDNVLETDNPYFISNDGRYLIFWSSGFYRKDRKTFSISVHEFMTRCKEWAYRHGYGIRTSRINYGYVIDVIKIPDDPSERGHWIKDIFDKETEDQHLHPKHFSDEMTAVQAVMNYILDEMEK